MQYCLPSHRGRVVAFEQKWSSCQLCPLQENRSKVVLWRGYLPCDILIVGEAPGSFEDAEGLPFIGPSGLLINDLCGDSETEYERLCLRNPRVKWCFTNVVCCLPPKVQGNLREPSSEEIAACKPRLAEFISLAEPRVVVAAGKVAAAHVEHQETIMHPSSLLQAGKHLIGGVYVKQIHRLVSAIEKVGNYERQPK